MQEHSQVSAFAPGHITGFFQIFANGSTGAGLNTALGARTEVRFDETDTTDSIYLNGERCATEAAVSASVLECYQQYRDGRAIRIEHYIEYPIGFGMGMSGAGAFSLSLALNSLLQSELGYEACMRIAKESEIKCGTGLGDVVAQQFPGVMIGLPPYPSTTVRLIEGTERFVACGFFEALETSSIIRNPEWVERINRIGGNCMEALAKDCTRRNFMELSRQFAFETELPSEQVRQVMAAVPECSMAMLGQSVFLLCDSVAEGIAILEPYAQHIVVSEIATAGAEVL